MRSIWCNKASRQLRLIRNKHNTNEVRRDTLRAHAQTTRWVKDKVVRTREEDFKGGSTPTQLKEANYCNLLEYIDWFLLVGDNKVCLNIVCPTWESYADYSNLLQPIKWQRDPRAEQPK